MEEILELTFPCGHRNYGTEEKPATVFNECPTCFMYYCEECNYDTHRCFGCGEDLLHGDRELKEGRPVHNAYHPYCYE